MWCGWMGYLRLCRWKVWRLVVSREFLGVEPFRPAAGYRDVDTEMERHVYSVGSGVACSALRWVYFCTVQKAIDLVISGCGDTKYWYFYMLKDAEHCAGKRAGARWVCTQNLASVGTTCRFFFAHV